MIIALAQFLESHIETRNVGFGLDSIIVWFKCFSFSTSEC